MIFIQMSTSFLCVFSIHEAVCCQLPIKFPCQFFFLIFPFKNIPEYDDDYEYGQSVDDDAPISPTDAQQWLYDRERGQQSMSEFIAKNRDIEEEDEEQCDPHDLHRRNSEV